jgi:hypothetical protein
MENTNSYQFFGRTQHVEDCHAQKTKAITCRTMLITIIEEKERKGLTIR